MNNWLDNAVFYEIYPQSFMDSNGDGIGDFQGIIQKLDYIKEMGFTAIWMNPCFDSPFYDAGYDIRDFYKVAPRYGTNEDLKQLFDEVHKRDMHILLDLVAGHTSIECEWFNQSKQPEPNRYSHRYIWSDVTWKDFSGVTGVKGSLRGISERDGSCAVNYYTVQPALNFGFNQITDANYQLSWQSEPAIDTRNEIINIIEFWAKLGVDGFRVDMANSLVKNDPGQECTIKLWQQIFEIINKDCPNLKFVSEWGEPDKALKAGFDMDFLLHFGPSHYNDMYHSNDCYFSGRGSSEEFFKYYTNVNDQVKDNGGYICLPSGNHDMQRLSYYLTEEQIKLVYAFMMAMPGVPFIYYGDEIGMKYLDKTRSKEGGYFRTGARTPMQWDSTKNCGFSTAEKSELYLNMDEDENRPTVEKQINDENSILNELKKQIKIRKANPSLQERAEFTLINGDYPLVFKRKLGREEMLIAINPTDTERTLTVNENAQSVVYSFNGITKIQDGVLTVPPLSATYLLIK